jgi:hypothetical protein
MDPQKWGFKWIGIPCKRQATPMRYTSNTNSNSNSNRSIILIIIIIIIVIVIRNTSTTNSNSYCGVATTYYCGACDGLTPRPTLRTKGGNPAPSRPRKKEARIYAADIWVDPGKERNARALSERAMEEGLKHNIVPETVYYVDVNEVMALFSKKYCSEQGEKNHGDNNDKNYNSR